MAPFRITAKQSLCGLINNGIYYLVIHKFSLLYSINIYWGTHYMKTGIKKWIWTHSLFLRNVCCCRRGLAINNYVAIWQVFIKRVNKCYGVAKWVTSVCWWGWCQQMLMIFSCLLSAAFLIQDNKWIKEPLHDITHFFTYLKPIFFPCF